VIQVRVDNVDPNQTMEIVRELRAQGLVQGTDFDFAYYQACQNYDGEWDSKTKHAVFKFHTEKYATLFAIKYS